MPRWLCLFTPVFLLLSGCKLTVETLPNSQNCTQAEQGGHRYLLSKQINTSGGWDIGYRPFNQLVLHSSCSAAQMSYSNNTTVFRWYQFDQPIEINGMHEIAFGYNAYGESRLEIKRLEKNGHWQEKTIEDQKVSRLLWTKEIQNGFLTSSFRVEITAAPSINDRTAQVIINSGVNTQFPKKTKTWNSNNQQWECAWFKQDGTQKHNDCSSEAQDDREMLQQTIVLDDYFTAFEQEPTIYNSAEYYQRQMDSLDL